MTRSETYERNAIREISLVVDEVVLAFRNRGFGKKQAMEQAALELGITPRRVQSFIYGDAFALATDEYQRIKARFLSHLDAEAERLARRSAELRARRRQMEML